MKNVYFLVVNELARKICSFKFLKSVLCFFFFCNFICENVDATKMSTLCKRAQLQNLHQRGENVKEANNLGIDINQYCILAYL